MQEEVEQDLQNITGGELCRGVQKRAAIDEGHFPSETGAPAGCHRTATLSAAFGLVAVDASHVLFPPSNSILYLSNTHTQNERLES